MAHPERRDNGRGLVDFTGGFPQRHEVLPRLGTPLIRTLWPRVGNPVHPFGDCYRSPRHVK